MINGTKQSVLAVIPARFASSRFPGKPLVDIGGKSMIQRVYEQVSAAKTPDKVLIATDDERIFTHVSGFGGAVVMTSDEHQSGTDRCAEVARFFPEYQVIVNVQGDEPFIQPAQIDALVGTLLEHHNWQIATLAKAISEPAALQNPNLVKVVLSSSQQALYFSRQAIPFLRNHPAEQWLQYHAYYKHIGLYAFKSEVLGALASLPPSTLEKAESLEQLRWLENGYAIGVGITTLETLGIDTPDDLERALQQV